MTTQSGYGMTRMFGWRILGSRRSEGNPIRLAAPAYYRKGKA